MNDRLPTPLPLSESLEPRKMIGLIMKSVIVFLLLLVLALGTGYSLNQPPDNFVAPSSFTIEMGEGAKSVTKHLEEQSIIKSGSFLYFVITLFYDAKNIKASTYVFETPLTSMQIAEKLVTGDFGNDLIKFTHIEGERATHIADQAERVLINFDADHFLERAVPLEGKLYPETYYIPKTFSADELIDLMVKTFAEKTQELQPQIDAYRLSYEEILVLASILEREANSPESMRMVSDILQRRLQEGMALQTDASIEYILDKPLKGLTPEDLEIDSPYNTYAQRGLPPTPIGNPGREAIMAVLEPTPNPYVYYITDDDGIFHYAITYDEHKANIAEYLR